MTPGSVGRKAFLIIALLALAVRAQETAPARDPLDEELRFVDGLQKM